MENRSEPQDWLTDGSEQGADPAQDGKSAAAVKTAPSLLGSGSRAGSPATDRDAASSAVDDTADPIPGITGDPGSWDGRSPGSSKSGSSRPSSRNSGDGSGNGSSGNRGSGDGRGSSRPQSGGGPGSPIGTAAGTAAGVSGASAMSAQYAPPDNSRGPQTAPFPNPLRARAQRPGRAPREQTFTGQRSAPAGFPAQGSASSRKAQLAVSRIEPWSVMKFSFMISLVGWVILFVAVALMYFVLQKIGVFTSIEHTVGLVTSSKGNSGTNAASWFSASRVLGYTMLIGAVNVILITALATIGAVLYNLVTMLAGGIEVTLKETE